MSMPNMVRNLYRAQEIFTVLVRHGFGDLLERTGLVQYVKSLGVKEVDVPPEVPPLQSSATRFREALEELGGAFVKFGQVLSTRPDILPPLWIEELSRLQDEIGPVDFNEIRKIIEEDLGNLESHFLWVDPTPLATGSVAQVHPGLAKSGEKIVVKVRKPDIKATILQDCDILQALAELLEKHVEESRNYHPVQVVAEFRAALDGELDFTQEGQNLDRFSADFEPDPQVVFPKVFWDHTTERVLTMERMEGIKVSLIAKLRENGADTSRIAHNLAESVLRQVLEFGFFHADPHPGNILALNGDRICFLDCGMVGRLDEITREHLVLLVSAGIRRDVATISDILSEMNALPEDVDRHKFMRDANILIDRYYRLPLKRVRLDSLINDAIRLVHSHRIQMPSDLVLVGKALMTLEGVGRTLDPNFEAVAVAEPFVRQIVLTSYGPQFLGRRLFEGAHDVVRLLRSLPTDIRELTRQLRESRFRIILEHAGLKESLEPLDRASRRLSVSLIIAAIVLASSIVALAPIEHRAFDIPIPALVGFGIAAALGLWLLIGEQFKKGP